MAFEKNYEVPGLTDKPACIHLRSKAMYVTGSLYKPDHPDEEGAQYCWCNVTQHIVGPDQEDVNRCDCTSNRGCYKNYS
ncbi:MAG: hypothetical protein MK006_03815 [Pirellulales bacterium]|nr:hypothetical protein [Pirellulales bacterium]|tara:strand:- start:364 stop:600 length:237 start_codon:yes stop_codon:yes gene_type:complete